MGLSRYKLGEFIEQIDERNSDGIINAFYGINISKEFMPTIANTDEIDSRKYKVIRKNRFVFSGMQTGRDECIRIGLYAGEKPIIVSPAYTTFEIIKPNLIINEYFFMNFLSKEMDRYGWFLSDSSVRSNLDWDRFCEIEIDLPSVPIQQKYIDVYNTILANQQAYAKSLKDLNIAVTANIENFKHTAPRMPVGELLEEIDMRNRDGAISNVQGININKEFMPSVANLSETDLTKYKVVNKNQFAANFMHVMRDEKIPFALYHEDEPCIISPAYPVFRVKSKDVLAEYVMLWINREESDRYAWFISDSSIRGGLEMSRFYEIEIPVPSVPQQQAVVNFYNAQHLIQQNTVKLGNLLKDICPILIKGAMEEAE